MSGYEEHFSAGLIVTFVAAFLFWLFGYIDYTHMNVIILVGISFVFSLLPDIDIGTSIIRKVAIAGFVVFLFIYGLTPMGYFLGFLLLGLQFLKHRGIMHSIIMGILLAGILYFYSNNWVFSVIALLNFCSHLWLDRR
jgi:membrane-bound metal-dependent hydrolase YbcI (DUF457 family)